MQKTRNNKYLKDYNRKTILNLVRLNKIISKIELAKQTGLSPTAAGKIVNSLIEEGYIIESFEGKSSGGRKPMMLSLSEDSYFSLGIDIEPRKIKFLVINLSGEKVYDIEVNNKPDNEFSIIIEILKHNVSSILNSLKIVKKLLGIGISIPALINQNKDKIIAPNLPWHDLTYNDFQDIFSDDIDIINEAKASAIFERFMGACMTDENFICLNIGSGIGAGIYIEGKLYLGSGGMAGEIGHIQVLNEGKLCGCGKYGCLETIASSKSIKEDVINGVKQNLIKSMSSLSEQEIDIEEISVLVKNKEMFILEILNSSGFYIGKAISYLVNIFNPSKIIIGKDFSLYGNLLINDIRKNVESSVVSSFKDSYKILVSENGENSSVHGAALIPLKRLMGLI